MIITTMRGVREVYSFSSGFVPAKVPAGRYIPEEDVLAYALEIAVKVSPQAADAYLNRWARSCVT